MAKRMPPIEETLAAELYDHFLEFVAAKKAIPIEHAFYQWLIKQNKYTAQSLKVWEFRYQFGKLIAANWIDVEPDTRSLVPRRNVHIEVIPD